MPIRQCVYVCMQIPDIQAFIDGVHVVRGLPRGPGMGMKVYSISRIYEIPLIYHMPIKLAYTVYMLCITHHM